MTSSSKWIRIAVIVAGGALFAALLHRVGVHDVTTHLLAVRGKVLWLALPYAVGTAIGAIPWGLLLPVASRPSLLALMMSRFAASGANTLSFGVGGEPCRLLWVRSEYRGLAFAALVVDRMAYNTSNALFLLVGVLTTTFMVNSPAGFALLGGVTAFGMCALTYAGGWAILSPAVGGRVHAWIKSRRSGVSAMANEGTPSAARRILDGRHHVVALATLVHLIGRTVLATEVYFALRAVGVHVDPWTALVLASGQVALSAVASWVPGQIGVMEGAQAVLCAAFGIDPALGVAAVLLQRIRQIAFVLPSPILIASAAPEPATLSARR